MNLSAMPGFGDEATWPPCSGHPNDPRTDDGPKEAAIDTRAAELLGTPGFTPFDPQNLCEALCETDDQAVTRLADLLQYLNAQPGAELAPHRERVLAYRDRYGVT